MMRHSTVSLIAHPIHPVINSFETVSLYSDFFPHARLDSLEDFHLLCILSTKSLNRSSFLKGRRTHPLRSSEQRREPGKGGESHCLSATVSLLPKNHEIVLPDALVIFPSFFFSLCLHIIGTLIK